MISILEDLVELVATGKALEPSACGCSLATAELIMSSDAFKAAVERKKRELALGD